VETYTLISFDKKDCLNDQAATFRTSVAIWDKVARNPNHLRNRAGLFKTLELTEALERHAQVRSLKPERIIPDAS